MNGGQITVEDHDGVTVVALLGEHDLSTAPDVGEALQPVGVGTVVDLTGITFLDSSILGALIAASRECTQRAAPFTVVLPDDPSSAARRIFDLTGLASALPIAADVAGAVESARGDIAPASQ
jgi:anti-sigma B factor antagonist